MKFRTVKTPRCCMKFRTPIPVLWSLLFWGGVGLKLIYWFAREVHKNASNMNVSCQKKVE